MSVVSRFPPWIRVPFRGGVNYRRVKGLLREHGLHTVCEEAHCPNIGECFEEGTATFMILGDVCTRACRYCAVTGGRPQGLDLFEPLRVARLVQVLGLRFAVITSVNRDDLPDGGASIFAACITQIRQRSPHCQVEVLIPDFLGSEEALRRVVEARPDVLNHNIETVPRLYPKVRHKGGYQRSLSLLARAKERETSLTTKSGIMVGLGEEWEELLETMGDLRQVHCDLLTLGQYLQPSPKHAPVARFYTPEEFRALAQEGRRLGFRHVEAGPLVRSSYHAHQQAAAIQQRA